LPKPGIPKGKYLGIDFEYYFKPNKPVWPQVLTMAISNDTYVKVEDAVS